MQRAAVLLLYIVDRDFGKVVGQSRVCFFILFEKSLYRVHNVGHHVDDFLDSVASAVDVDQADVALINREEGYWLNCYARAAAAAEEIFFLVL